MKYKRQLNPKCVRFFQKPSKAENSLAWYTNVPLGHNSIGDMMPTISASAGLSKRYTNHSLRSTTVHILDANEFAGRHITSITGHKSENSLKTYTGYTAPSIKRKMSDTITDTLRSKLQKVETITDNKENSVSVITSRSEHIEFHSNSQEVDIGLANSQLIPLSNSQYDNLMSDLQEDTPFDELLSQIDTRTVDTEDTLPKSQSTVPKNFPMPIFHGCSNITINFNWKN